MVKKANGKLAGAAKLVAGRRALRETLAEAEPIDADITIDDVPLPGEAKLAVEIVNTSYTGPGLPLAPTVIPGDGMLGIIAIGSDEREAMISWIEAPHRKPMPVAVLRGRKVECTWDGAPFQLDDDVMEIPRGRHSGTVELRQIGEVPGAAAESAITRVKARNAITAHLSQIFNPSRCGPRLLFRLRDAEPGPRFES